MKFWLKILFLVCISGYLVLCTPAESLDKEALPADFYETLFRDHGAIMLLIDAGTG